jgi:hypothetical protein
MKYKRHIAYLKYIIRHKWFVFKASRYTKCSLKRAILHDLSKFLPCEWMPYANSFYRDDGRNIYIQDPNFDYAWNHHLHLNPHHWQYWVLKGDDKFQKALEIPDEYLREMVADWFGAGKAIKGSWNISEWWTNYQKGLIIHPNSLEKINTIINSTQLLLKD